MVGSAVAATGRRSVLSGALRHRNFRLFLLTQSISLIGTWMQNVALSWLVYRLTGSELLLGTTSFVTHLPVFLLGPIAGVVADRYSRRRIVLCTQLLFLIQACLLAWLTLSGRITVTHIICLAAFVGTANAFDVPARQSLMIHMTTKEDLLGAISLNSAIFNTARVVGPSIGGLLVAAVGEGPCFVINAISFLGIIIFFSGIKLNETDRGGESTPGFHTIVEGFRYAWSRRPVRFLLMNCGIITMASAPALVLGPVFADAIFHKGSRGLGFLMAAMGCGAVAGTLSLARRTGAAGLHKVAAASSLLLAIAMSAYAWSPLFALSLGIMTFIGFGTFRQNAAANTMIQTLIDDDYRGRVMSIYSMAAIGMLPLGSLSAGLLASKIGARSTVFLAGLLCFLGAAALWRFRADFEGQRGTV